MHFRHIFHMFCYFIFHYSRSFPFLRRATSPGMRASIAASSTQYVQQCNVIFPSEFHSNVAGLGYTYNSSASFMVLVVAEYGLAPTANSAFPHYAKCKAHRGNEQANTIQNLKLRYIAPPLLPPPPPSPPPVRALNINCVQAECDGV